jgi:nucleotide-binding universal stress UspA family protein
MATHGRRGLAHLVAGSIAEDVVNHIECPIWTYSLHKK